MKPSLKKGAAIPDAQYDQNRLPIGVCSGTQVSDRDDRVNILPAQEAGQKE